MIKLLHTADWQIGKQYGRLDLDDATLLAEARFVVVERLAKLACEQAVDAVLVAGDVFDAQGVADRTLFRLFDALAAFAGPWVMIPGNHDAALSESVWTRAVRLQAVPANVHLCLSPQPLLLPALKLAVLPAPLTQRHTARDLTEWFDSAQVPSGMFRVGLAHGSVQGILAEDIDSSNPIAAGRAAQAGLDYLALGDWHGCKQVDARTWYSGTPETDRFRANDSGQALIVQLQEPGAPPHMTPHMTPHITPHPTGQYRWRQETLALQVPTDVDAALLRLAALGANDVCELQLTGRVDLAGQKRLQDAIGQAKGRARSLSCELSALRLEATAEDIANLRADGYLGEVLAELQAAQHIAAGADADDEAKLAHDALVLLAGLLDELQAGRSARAKADGAAMAEKAAP